MKNNTYQMITYPRIAFTYLGIFFLALVVGTGCQNENFKQAANQSISLDIPALLDRPPLIQYGEEWDMVQNTYGRFRNDLQKNENDYLAYLKLAEVFLNEARITGEHGHYYPAALAMTNNLLDKSDLDQAIIFQAKALKASALLSQHEFVAAEKMAKEAIAMNPYNAQIYGALIDARVELGKYDAAVEAADKMIGIRPDLRSYARISYLRELHGDISGSFAAMEQAIQSGYPGFEETAWTQLTYAELLLRYGSTEKAAKVLANILLERPNYPFAIGALAKIKINQGDDEGAEILLNKAAAIIPEVGFYIDLANIYKKQKRTNEFMKTVKEVQVMFAEDVASGHNMNLEYVDFYLNTLEDYDLALTFAQKEYEIRPENIIVNKLLSQIYFAKNDMIQAQSFLKKATITNAQDPELLSLKEEIGAKGLITG